MALNFPDPGVTNPWYEPDNDQWWEYDGEGWVKIYGASVNHSLTLNRDAADSHPPSAISGLSLPNLLLNAGFMITTHGGGNRTPGTNVYGFNRWRGSATGLRQTVEGKSLMSEEYTLSWGGGGTGALNGTGGTSPITVSLSAGSNTNAEVPSNATWAKLERGSIVTPYQAKDIGEDTSACARYYFEYDDLVYLRETRPNSGQRSVTLFMPTILRVNPAVTYGALNNINALQVVARVAQTKFHNGAVPTDPDGVSTIASPLKFDAEIYG